MMKSVSAGPQLVRALVPELSHSHHKGSCGRIAVIGGSEDYSGAPFLAAMGSLRTGADMATIFCPPAAAASIKSYSPDIIVRPLLNLGSKDGDGEGVDEQNNKKRRVTETANELVAAVTSRAHTCVIGPGLGTELCTSDLVNSVIDGLKASAAPSLRVVLDACAITALCRRVDEANNMLPDSSPGELDDAVKKVFLGPRFVLTPNAVEFNRLCTSARLNNGNRKGEEEQKEGTEEEEERAARLAEFFGGCTIVRKGAADLIATCRGQCTTSSFLLFPQLLSLSETHHVLAVRQDEELGSRRRAAGQGDVFCGVLAAFLTWGAMREPAVDAASCAYAASFLMKTCAKVTEEEKGATFIASDMLPLLAEARKRVLSHL